jgi:hypothetical protein
MALGGNDEAGGHGSGQLMPSSRGDIGAHYPGPINEPSAKAQPERLVSQKQATVFLHVSQTYLRASSCPKVLLPGRAKATKSLNPRAYESYPPYVKVGFPKLKLILSVGVVEGAMRSSSSSIDSSSVSASLPMTLRISAFCSGVSSIRNWPFDMDMASS